MCPACRSDDVVEEGQDDMGIIFYECSNCDHQFDMTEIIED